MAQGKIRNADIAQTISIAKGGTGLTSIAALSLWVANSADTLVAITPSAGQSVRVNAGGTAFEAYTPGSGGTPAGSNTQLQYNNAGSFGGMEVEYTFSGGTVTLETTTGNDLSIFADGILALGATPASASSIVLDTVGVEINSAGDISLTPDTGNNVKIFDDSGFAMILDTSALSADRTFTFPNTTGTVALSTGALTQFVGNTAWRVFYSDASGDIIELALGADGTFLKSNGASAAPTFATPAGSGDVSKVGTPVDNQIGVWTSDGTLEGTTGLTYNGSNLLLTGDIGATGTRITKGWFTDLQVTNAIAGSITGNAATVTGATFTTALTVNTGTVTLTGNVANSSVLTIGAGAVSVSGTNTGDQTTVSGNAGTATTLQNTRTIWGQNFNGSANVTGTLALGTADLTLTGSVGATGARATKVWATDIESTNMPTVGGTAILSSLTAPSFTTIELGAGGATDTTLSRVSAGVVAIEGVNIITTANISDTAYADSWNGVTTIAPSKNAIWDADFTNNDYVRTIQALGSTVKFLVVGMTSFPLAPAGSGTALVDNTAKYVAVYINKETTITGVKWYQVVQGNYTADQNNYVALYSYSGGTMTQVAISANDGNIWKAASGMASAAFTSTYAASPGVYFIGLLYNQSAQTTAPTVATSTNSNNLIGTGGDLTNSARIVCTVATQNTLPATQDMTGVSGNAVIPWLALY